MNRFHSPSALARSRSPTRISGYATPGPISSSSAFIPSASTGSTCSSMNPPTRSSSPATRSDGAKSTPRIYLGGALGALPQQGGQRRDRLRVELRASVARELRDGLTLGHRRPVGPVAGHRGERVDDVQDARLERDFGAGEPGRVAAAVDSLVVFEH